MALRDKLNEAAFNGVNYDDMVEVLDDVDNALENSGGNSESSAKLDQIIADRGVGVKTEKAPYLDITVEEEDWTYVDEEGGYYTCTGETDFSFTDGEYYTVIIDGVEYYGYASFGEVYVYPYETDAEEEGEEERQAEKSVILPRLDKRGNTKKEAVEPLAIITADGTGWEISWYDTAADHRFVVTKNINLSFETPEASEWNVEDGVAWASSVFPEAYGIVGEEYTVTFDGVEYTLTCKNDIGDPYLGNGHLADDSCDDTGEPFFIDLYGGSLACAEEDAGVHSVSIVHTEYDYQKIDEKYLPATYNSIAVVNISQEQFRDGQGASFYADKTFDEIDALIQDGKAVIAAAGGPIAILAGYGEGFYLFQSMSVSGTTLSVSTIEIGKSGGSDYVDVTNAEYELTLHVG